ncbi:spore germination protein [Paenibacillus sp. YYML68]|uniref:spore germination protein n=1 Tax=Paenibacillus sp. YYML68 TaxID=2909250 RepID=UPI0024913F52|nr:spore germination protein [Paenibacillus sp. YYML68]
MFGRNHKSNPDSEQAHHSDQRIGDLSHLEQPLQSDYARNVDALRSIYAHCSDVNFRSFLIGGKTNAMLIYIEGLCNTAQINEHVLGKLVQANNEDVASIEMLVNTLTVSKADIVTTLADCTQAISAGNPVLLYEGEAKGASFGLSEWEKRSVEEPTAESGVRGPREGFSETLQVNTSQLRRIIKSPALKLESVSIGQYTQTQVIVAYIEGVADPKLIEDVKERLDRIQINGILESGYIEEMIEDNPYSPFPQVQSTERPDTACSALLEGRVAILTEGTPFVLIVPTTLFSLLQSQEDYYQRFWASTAIRWLRYLFTLFSILLPSLYVAIITFHQEMVPTALLITMAASRESVPFPALIEAFIMEVTFEVLREAGVRLPKQIGPAVSIVGALVIGQAAVQAGIVSPPMVIVVAITGIASFMVPRYIVGLSFRMLRFPIILLSGTLGLLGVILGMCVIVIHLCNLRSFGSPYLLPLSSVNRAGMKDIAVRAPWWELKSRS